MPLITNRAFRVIPVLGSRVSGPNGGDLRFHTITSTGNVTDEFDVTADGNIIHAYVTSVTTSTINLNWGRINGSTGVVDLTESSSHGNYSSWPDPKNSAGMCIHSEDGGAQVGIYNTEILVGRYPGAFGWSNYANQDTNGSTVDMGRTKLGGAGSPYVHPIAFALLNSGNVYSVNLNVGTSWSKLFDSGSTLSGEKRRFIDGDGAGNIYIALDTSPSINKYNSAGVSIGSVTFTGIGSVTGGDKIRDFSVDYNGNIYIAKDNHIFRLRQDTESTEEIAPGEFDSPFRVLAMEPDFENILVYDSQGAFGGLRGVYKINVGTPP